MRQFLKLNFFALLIICFFGGTGPTFLHGQCSGTLAVQLGMTVTGNTLQIYSVSNEDVTGPPTVCITWTGGSQITLRWPSVGGLNPVAAVNYTPNALNLTQNAGVGGPTGIGSDGGDGFYYVQFTNSGFGNQALSSSSNLLLFSLEITAGTMPAAEFVPLGGGPAAFPNTDAAFFMAGSNVFNNFIPNGAFPVEWSHFDAKEINVRDVELTWGTFQEVNNKYFQIEKSIDGQVFESIGIVDGYGSTNEPQEYKYIDTDYVADRVFYRLKQVDINGQYEYSTIEEVLLNGALNALLKFEVSPNPATEKVVFTYLGKQTGIYDLMVTDAYGKQVLKDKFDLSDGKFEMQVENLSEGIYYASLSSLEGNIYTVGKFLKQ